MPCKNECAIIDTIYTRSVPTNLGHNQVGNGTGITDRSEKTIRSVKAGRFCSWRSEISGHFLHFT